MEALPNGVYSLTLTPFTQANTIDYGALGALIEWYRENNSAGLFALCATSEMETLTLRERVEMAEFFVRHKGGMKILCSGHVSANPKSQLEELRAIAETGVDGLVLIKHRLHIDEASGSELSADAAFENLKRLTEALPMDCMLGFYEQPYNGPHKLLPDDWVKWCAESGRFGFVKDTTCTVEGVRRKLELTKNSIFKIFNANGTFFYDTLLEGAHGYSGNFSNFCPGLFAWVCENYVRYPETAKRIGRYLSIFSRAVEQYPLSAKYFLSKRGIPMQLTCRRSGYNMDSIELRARMEHFAEVIDDLTAQIQNPC